MTQPISRTESIYFKIGNKLEARGAEQVSVEANPRDLCPAVDKYWELLLNQLSNVHPKEKTKTQNKLFKKL